MTCVVSIISDKTELMALFVGPQSKIPRAALVVINKITIRVFFDPELLETMVDILVTRD